MKLLSIEDYPTIDSVKNEYPSATMRHINEFRAIFGLPKIRNGEWNAL